MSASLNHCQFIGNLGAAAEVKYTAAGDAVCNIRIACNETWKDKSGEKQEKTEWVSCTAFKRVAEIIGEYTKKGSRVYVSGRMQTRKWTDKEGVEKYTTEIIVDRLILLDGRTAQGESSERPAARGSGAAKPKTDDFDDDIPFIINELHYIDDSKIERRLRRGRC